MSPVGQDTRVARLETAFGNDILALVEFNGEEGLSELFEYRVEAVSEAEADFDNALGRPSSVHIENKSGTERHFHGILTEAVWLGSRGGLYRYRLTIRPWLWLLSHTTDCRIFHNKTSPDIIKDVLSEYEFARISDKLTENYEKREYCVQYRESDFAFVSRLMEEEGIYYFFDHRKDQHELVLADAKASHKRLPQATLPYVSIDDRIRRSEDSITGVTVDRRFCSGKVRLEEFDYLNPTSKMTSHFQQTRKHQVGELELYDYPGRYVTTSVGDRLARVLLESGQARDRVHHAVGDAVGATPGFLAKIAEHPTPSLNAEYMVVRCAHTLRIQEYRSGSGDTWDELYTGRYELLPSDVPFRAPRRTPLPHVRGPQTAIVVDRKAQGAEEIESDEHGRILVKFHWDHRRDLSRWVRIAQTWAGKSWGTMVIPRVGQEVVVDFLEGDPDQPLVVGAVYNGANPPPYDLPAEQTRTVMKSNSSKGGNGFNEFTIDDKRNHEEIKLHAQKDLNITILDRESRTIGERFTAAEGDSSRETVLEHGDDSLELKSGSLLTKVGVDVKTEVTGKVEITAGLEISLTVGSSSLKITPDGVVVKGAARIELDGGAMLIEKAGIIKLN